MNKKDLSESDIKAKFITPAITEAGWDDLTQLGREIFFTDGRIYVKGRLTARGKRKFADYILFYKVNVPIAALKELEQQLYKTGA
jgi:type I restriction enzyme R subunit